MLKVRAYNIPLPDSVSRADNIRADIVLNSVVLALSNPARVRIAVQAGAALPIGTHGAHTVAKPPVHYVIPRDRACGGCLALAAQAAVLVDDLNLVCTAWNRCIGIAQFYMF